MVFIIVSVCFVQGPLLSVQIKRDINNYFGKQSLIIVNSNMTETIQDYFTRFDNSVTESVYSHFTLADFQRNKAVNEFLDYDRESLFRKNCQYCGIRNIDNSCYLSVTLQILYNIQGLRERIFRVPEDSLNQFLRELQKLFAMMSKGSLLYVDPTKLFSVLKKMHPNLFIAGDQNDFHEVFTIVLDELQKSFTTEEDKRFIKKIFYGKTKIQSLDIKKNGANSSANDPGNSFNIINLSSENQTFQNALKQYKKESIDGYVNEKGEQVNAEREIHFIQTPGILSFFINRVSYKDKKLHKDSSQFKFEDKIYFNKTNIAKIGSSSDTQLEKMQKNLRQWVENIQKSKDTLLESLKYFEEKEFIDVNMPSIMNPLEESGKEKIKPYLKAEIQQIQKKVKEAEKEIEDIEVKRMKMAEQNYSQLYHIWAVMIHAGKTADSGHYKMCIKVSEQKDIWVQFNDRRTEEVKSDKINQYAKKGQICCLFYRRSSLVCRSQISPIPSTLKKLVKEEEAELFKKIDNARILQALYQQFESATMVWEFENLLIRQQQKISTYFFKPMMHLILSGASSQTCKGYILYEMVRSRKFIQNLSYKLLDPCRDIKVPKIDFRIPSEYFQLSEGLRQFSTLEINSPVEAYDLISFYLDITMNNKILQQMFIQIRQVILMKGIFYQFLFVDSGISSAYEAIKKSNDRIINAMRVDDQCTLVNVPLRAQIQNRYHQLSKNPSYGPKGVVKKMDLPTLGKLKQNYPNLFLKRFQFWIKLREKMIQIDESLLSEYKKMSSSYITQIE